MISSANGELPDSAPIYSNFEGHLDSRHDQEMQNKRDQYFFSNGILDFSKIELLKLKVIKLRSEIMPSIFQHHYNRYINKFHYSEKKAYKSATKKVESKKRILLIYDELINGVNDLLIHGPQNDWITLRDKVEDLLLLLSLIETPYSKSIYTDYIHLLNMIKRRFYKIPKISKGPHASNLIKDGHFLKSDEVTELFQSGADLSLLNPPNTAFWQDNNIEKFDPEDETFRGRTIFPPKETPFYYKRMGSGTLKIKADWEEEKNEKIKSHGITLRVGKEVRSGILSGFLIKSLGFHTIPMVFRKRVKLYLLDTSYDSFLKQWKSSHGFESGSPLSFIEEYNKDEHYVILKDVSLESLGSEKYYRKIGSFRTGRNGMRNRREYRSFLLMAALISLNDVGDRQVRIDMARKDKKSPWQPVFFFSDTGYSMGSFLIWNNMGSVNDYRSVMSHKKKKSVRINWAHKGLHKDIWNETNYEDVRWLIRRMIRLSSDQLYKMAIHAGFTAPEARLYQKKIATRINKFSKDFGLAAETRLLPIMSNKKLHKMYPKYITKKGKITAKLKAAYQLNVKPLGNFNNPSDTFILAPLKFVTNKLLGFLDITPSVLKIGETFDIGTFTFENTFILGGSRSITVNNSAGKEQGRYLVKDTYTVSIPIGTIAAEVAKLNFRVNAPLSFYYKYSFDFYQSFEKKEDALKKNFLQTINPFRANSLKKHLTNGQSLTVHKGLGYSIGVIGAGIKDLADISLTPFSYEYVEGEKIFISKNKDILEIITKKNVAKVYRSNIGLDGVLKLFFDFSHYKNSDLTKIYRIDFKNMPEHEQGLFEDFYYQGVVNNDYRFLDKYSLEYVVDRKQKGKKSSYGAFIHQFSKGSNQGNWILGEKKGEESNQSAEDKDNYSSEYTEAKNIYSPQDMSYTYVYTVSNFYSTDKSLKKIFDTGISAIDIFNVNYLFDFTIESKSGHVSLEGVANKDFSNFERVSFRAHLNRIDNWASRKEYRKDFKNYFSKRSGHKYVGLKNKNYFKYQLPEHVKKISPLRGSMKWEIETKGIYQFLDNVKKDRDFCKRRCLIYFSRLKKLSKFKSNSTKKKKQNLKARLNTIKKIFKISLGHKYKNIGLLRKYIDEENLWLVSRIGSVIELTVGLAKGPFVDSYAEKVGKHQGFSFLEDWKFRANTLPYYNYPLFND